jgi:Na+/melibiose symporter-like transporter
MRKEAKDLTSGTYTGDVIPKKTAWIYSMSGIFRDMCYALISGGFLNYAKTAGLLDKSQYTAQLSTMIALYIVCLIWDGFNDPIMGIIIEKCHFKTGKFRPWILIGAVGNAAMLLLMFLTKPHGWAFVTCFFIYYFLWDLVFTMNDIGYWSMLPSLSGDEKERNKITTMVTVATTIGSVAMYGCTGLLVKSYNISYIYGYIAIPVAILFLLGQTAVFFFCKEHARDPEQDKVSDKTKFSDLFKMIKENKPLRMVVIAIFFYYVLGAVLQGYGYDYFYFIYGYGGNLGGKAATYFLAVYVLSALLAQGLYTLIAKKFTQKNIIRFTFVVCLVSFVAFFILGFPIFPNHQAFNAITGQTVVVPLAYTNNFYQIQDATSNQMVWTVNPLSGTAWLIFIPVLFFSSSMGVMYLALLVMMQNSIEYNEWKFGERKEAIAFSWRPLDAKLSSALKQGLYLLTLVASGTLSVYNQIDDITEKVQTNAETESQAESDVQNAIGRLSTENINSFGYWMVGTLIVCITIAYLAIELGFHLSEEDHKKIMKELADRKATAAKLAESAKPEDKTSVTAA